jgi:hypothetical protein
MNSISSVSATTTPYQPSSQADFSTSIQDFNAIGSALQSGDLSNAQTAVATFQQSLQANSQTSTDQPFGKNSKANNDFQSLTRAIQSGDVAAAQKAFSNLQTDLKVVRKGHHHHHAAVTQSTIATPSSQTASALNSDGNQNASRINLTA